MRCPSKRVGRGTGPFISEARPGSRRRSGEAARWSDGSLDVPAGRPEFASSTSVGDQDGHRRRRREPPDLPSAALPNPTRLRVGSAPVTWVRPHGATRPVLDPESLDLTGEGPERHENTRRAHRRDALLPIPADRTGQQRGRAAGEIALTAFQRRRPRGDIASDSVPRRGAGTRPVLGPVPAPADAGAKTRTELA